MRVVRGSELRFIAASHEDTARQGSFKRILASRDDLIPGRVQMVNWAQIPGGSSFRAHYHEDMEEVFVIINGQVQLSVEGEVVVLRPGDAIFIEPGEVHSMTNSSEVVLDYLVIGIDGDKNGKTVVI